MAIRTPSHNAADGDVTSVVVPMYNEAANLPGTLQRIVAELERANLAFEIVPVSDGSSDDTAARLDDAAMTDARIRPVIYSGNRGRGYAVRRGFAAARGGIIMTTDADLSYDPCYLPRMATELRDRPEVDFVVGSPYTGGGATEGVPFGRLVISRLANWIIGFAMRGKLRTVTGILRAYRREVLASLDLESEGKELNLEIVSKALAAGFTPFEMPAVLTGRKRGKSKLVMRATVASHLVFSFYEKPLMLFGIVGAVVGAAGVAGGLWLIALWQQGTLNPNRPLMTLTVILLVSGLQIVLFGFLGSQIVQLRREIYRVHRNVHRGEERVDALSRRLVATQTPGPPATGGDALPKSDAIGAATNH